LFIQEPYTQSDDDEHSSPGYDINDVLGAFDEHDMFEDRIEVSQ
jgi:hypothetical protein